MLFNSFVFILLFLPVALIAYYGLHGLGRPRLALAALFLLSLVFYGYGEPRYLPVLLLSIGVNYAIGKALLETPAERHRRRRALLIGGIAFDLGLLGVFKYLGFFAQNLEAVSGAEFDLVSLTLPIGISFYTFQQIGYLVDCARGRVSETGPTRYGFFVTFFPQLIAGPIVHHAELLPQLGRDPRRRAVLNLAIGATIFAAGLFKKVVIADMMALPADAVFGQAALTGVPPDLLTAWIGTLAYTLQIYFDFSAYSDMAVGLARMFGLRLPINFASPYKARSIIEFWRRWHITLSRFLRDYLYLPLGGSRRGEYRRYGNLMATMLLGGLWHGAAWSFVLWGGMHGLMLVINHLWRDLGHSRGLRLPAWAGWALTFLGVTIAWVPFRAADMGVTALIYQGMFLPQTIILPENLAFVTSWLGASVGEIELQTEQIQWIPVLLAVTWLAPNIYEIMRAAVPALSSRGYPATFAATWARRLRWSPRPAWSTVAALLLIVSLLKLNDISTFIYFRF